MTVVGFDPVKDKTYRATSLGRDVAAFLDWKELGGASPRTLDQYERDLARGAQMFPDRTAATLTDQEAIHIAKQFSQRERRVRVAAWNSFYRWAKQMRLTDRNPFDVLPTIKRPQQQIPNLFTEAEVEALCALEVRDGALMEIMFGTGGRKGDCRRLQLRHFIPSGNPDEEDAIVFLEGKGGKSRRVRVLPRVSQAIAKLSIYEGLNADDHLWYSVQANAISSKVVRSKPVGEGTFARWWSGCLERAGVEYRNPHVARHTFATQYLRDGGRSEVLSKLLGHASTRTTTDLYVHLDDRDVLADLAVIRAARS